MGPWNAWHYPPMYWGWGPWDPTAGAPPTGAPSSALAAPQPIICLVKPTKGDATADVAMIAQSAEACTSIDGTVAASERTAHPPAAASGGSGG